MPDSLQLPPISFVMPVLNEQHYLRRAVTAVLAQEYPAAMELLLVLGPSTDASNQVAAELAAAHPSVRLLENPARDIPAALNIAFAAARFDVVIRVDAHSELSCGYARRAVTTLLTSGACNVGGIMRAAGFTPVQRAIAACYNSRFGLGGGIYHSDAPAGPAESAYLGVFRRADVLAVGGFDEGIRRGEDWELNLRLRQSGRTVWFDPALQVTYRPRASLGGLARQFFATGVWRAVLVKRHLRLHPLRFFVPGALVLSLCLSVLLLTVCAVLSFGAGVPQWLWALAAFGPLCYLLLLTVGASSMRPRGIREFLLRMLVLATMHLCWGTGFLRGLLIGAGDTVDTSRAR